MRHRRAPIDTDFIPGPPGMQDTSIEITKTSRLWEETHKADEELRAGAQILEITEPQLLLINPDPRAILIYQVLANRGQIDS